MGKKGESGRKSYRKWNLCAACSQFPNLIFPPGFSIIYKIFMGPPVFRCFRMFFQDGKETFL